MIKAIFQDSRGFLWIGTQNGLNRYDGYTFKIFKHDPQDSTTISNNIIWKIFEDCSQNLWIGTANGLNKFDHATETFVRYLHDANDSHSLSDGIVKAIHEDRTGTLWIGTWSTSPLVGLNEFDRQTGKFTLYQHHCNIPNIQYENAIWFILEDHAGKLWMGTETGGVVKFDPATEKFKHYLHDPNDPKSKIWAGYQARSGLFWFGSRGAGLKKIRPAIRKGYRLSTSS
jgi:ligand-binding sensor domain-containing protein